MWRSDLLTKNVCTQTTLGGWIPLLYIHSNIIKFYNKYETYFLATDECIIANPLPDISIKIMCNIVKKTFFNIPLYDTSFTTG